MLATLIVSLCATTAADELSGLRLFFEAGERSPEPNRSTAEDVETDATDPAVTERESVSKGLTRGVTSRRSINKIASVSSNRELVFGGLLGGPQLTQVFVNNLPCLARTTSNPDQLSVSCHFLHRSGFEVRLDLRNRTLFWQPDDS